MKENEQKSSSQIRKRVYEKPELILLSDMSTVEGKPYAVSEGGFTNVGPS